MKKFSNPLGIFSWFGFVMPLQNRLELIKKAGFDATTIWWEDEIGAPKIRKEQMPALVRDAGLFLENIHVPYEDADDFWSDLESVRDKVVDRHLRWLNDCAALGIPVLLMHIIDRRFSRIPNKWGIESLSCLVQAAEDLGVKIAVENTGSVDYVDFVLNELDSDHLRFCYDSSHDFIYSSNPGSILKRQGKRLAHLHLSDNDLQYDRHWLPGEGIIDWDRIGGIFPTDTYQGNITLEIYPKETDLCKAPGQFIEKAYSSAVWVRNKLGAEKI